MYVKRKVYDRNESVGLFFCQGCFNMIQMEINRNLMIVGILAFVLVFVEVCIHLNKIFN